MAPPITILDSLSNSQLDGIVKLSMEAFTGDPLSDAMSAGNPKLKEDLYRLTFLATALEGKIIVCQDNGNILSVAACFEPGFKLLGSEAQRALGFDEFLESLPKETRQWFMKIFSSGDRTVPECWTVPVMATSVSEQGKGYGTLVLKEICKKAEVDANIVRLNASPETNVVFYRNLGFKIIKRIEDVSPSGVKLVNTIMVWGARD